MWVKTNKGKEPNADVCEYMRQNLTYDPDTGQITRSDRRDSTGSVNDRGYRIIKVKGKRYRFHRLAWFLHYGKWPEKELDHINGDKLDNRICNLREVFSVENANNRGGRKKDPITGCLGIHIIEGLRKKYTTRIQGRNYLFATLEEAIQFRLSNNLKI